MAKAAVLQSGSHLRQSTVDRDFPARHVRGISRLTAASPDPLDYRSIVAAMAPPSGIRTPPANPRLLAKVQICKLRSWLAGVDAGVAVKNVRGRGWRLVSLD